MTIDNALNYYVRAKTSANLRQEPDVDSDVIHAFSRGDKLQVRGDPIRGWLSARGDMGAGNGMSEWGFISHELVEPAPAEPPPEKKSGEPFEWKPLALLGAVVALVLWLLSRCTP